MKLITIAGPPSTGKTSVILKTVSHLKSEGVKIGIVKFDALSTSDDLVYKKIGLPVLTGLAGILCPDHFFITNIEDCFNWGVANKLDMLITESAGLCNRCSPHIQGVFGVCVIDNLAGINTPQKIGPMLKLADMIVITKGDIVSQAEREVFAFNVALANPRAGVIFVNGITGQGSGILASRLRNTRKIKKLEGERARSPLPAAICPYCVGETTISKDYHRGNAKKIFTRQI
jgi:Ni2+-binding GTPase involved in maturation of urease and hydrogenase